MIDSLLNYWYFIRDNWDVLAVALAGMLGSLIVFLRVFPTQKPDSFLTRLIAVLEKLDGWLDKLMDMTKVPNTKREGLKLIAGVHKKEE